MPFLPTNSRVIANPTPCGYSRRGFLWELGAGFASLPLVDLLGQNGFFTAKAAAAEKESAGARVPAKAKHCIFLFMNGAPSQVDTFDPKPELTKHDGQPYHGKQKFGS